ncbi:mitochondrial transcription rescue factor 1, partial [Notothenia coriiceps]|uniref:Mitochondrial transcription rescue factor 1 n=1 Tax=Notothenia coriiceps TaxID=8208 RepID=A0A6I9P2L6_9TELE
PILRCLQICSHTIAVDVKTNCLFSYSSKIEVSFYDNKLRLNGQKLIKKSKTVKVGDTLDLILSENGETNTVTLMRVCLRRVLEEMSHTEKYKVAIRRWKCLELPKEEAFKP